MTATNYLVTGRNQQYLLHEIRDALKSATNIEIAVFLHQNLAHLGLVAGNAVLHVALGLAFLATEADVQLRDYLLFLGTRHFVSVNEV